MAGLLFKRRAAAAGTEGEDAPPTPAALVPTDSTAGRSLVIVIAIMTFLAGLALGGALLVADASADWRNEVSREASVQLRAVSGRDMEEDVRKAAELLRATPGIADVRVYTKAESEALLAPWLGQGLDLSELPTPRMIVVRLSADKRADIAKLRDDLAKAVPTAAFDDHKLFVARLGEMAKALVAAVIAIFALILVAMAVAVASATRAAVSTNREIVEVLHIVGAADPFIAREFQRRFFAFGLRGAMIGGGAAMAFFALGRWLAGRFTATAGGDQIEAIFGGFALGPSGYAAILALAAIIAALTGVMSRAIVLRRLRRLT